MAVSSGARRRGIARRLMAEAEATAAEWGFRVVSLVGAFFLPGCVSRWGAAAGRAALVGRPAPACAMPHAARYRCACVTAPHRRAGPPSHALHCKPPPLCTHPPPQHCDETNSVAWALYRELGYRRVALEAPWAPYLNGRAPNRCWLMIKRLPAQLVEAAREREEARQREAAAAAAGGEGGGGGKEGGRQGAGGKLVAP